MVMRSLDIHCEKMDLPTLLRAVLAPNEDQDPSEYLQVEGRVLPRNMVVSTCSCCTYPATESSRATGARTTDLHSKFWHEVRSLRN